MDEREFERRIDESFSDLDTALGTAAETYEIEPDFNAGTVTVEFEEPPAKFVVSPNSPMRQVWVSALTTSFKLDWNAERGEFVLGETGQSLKALMAYVIGKQLGEDVKL